MGFDAVFSNKGKFQNWYPKEPKPGKSSHCMQMQYTTSKHLGKWKGVHCSEAGQYVCEKKAGRILYWIVINIISRWCKVL